MAFCNFIREHWDDYTIIDISAVDFDDAYQAGMEQLWSVYSFAASCALAANSTPVAVDRVHHWMVDSGASYSVLNTACFIEPRSRTTNLGTPRCVATANGDMMLKSTVETFIPSLGINVVAYLADKCTNILSMGELCTKYGFSFSWDPDGAPILIRPDGVQVPIQVQTLCAVH